MSGPTPNRQQPTGDDALLDACRAGEAGANDKLWMFVRMLARRLIGRERLPARDDGGSWQLDEADDLAQELWLSGRVRRAIDEATDGADLRTRLLKGLYQRAVELHRASTNGALYQRVKKIIKVGPFVETLAGWDVTSAAPVVPSAPVGLSLRAVAHTIEVRKIPQQDDARATSFAPREHLVALVTAVLQANGAPMPLDEIVELVADRLADVPHGDAISVEETDGGRADSAEDVALDHLDGRDQWAALRAHLTPDEQCVLLYRDLPDRELGERLGFGKSKAGALKKSVAAKLALQATGGHGNEMLRTTGEEGS